MSRTRRLVSSMKSASLWITPPKYRHCIDCLFLTLSRCFDGERWSPGCKVQGLQQHDPRLLTFSIALRPAASSKTVTMTVVVSWCVGVLPLWVGTASPFATESWSLRVTYARSQLVTFCKRIVLIEWTSLLFVVRCYRRGGAVPCDMMGGVTSPRLLNCDRHRTHTTST